MLLINTIEEAKQSCQAERIFVGIEATGHYYEDIVRILTDKGYSVHIIIPASTHEERKQHLTYTKTDDIDLYLIAEVLIGNKATNTKLASGVYKQLYNKKRDEADNNTNFVCFTPQIVNRFLMGSYFIHNWIIVRFILP
ncbi:transposase [Neobacillus drentensis]|uniref:IS110 family transposase n=1 Tax=Neobacillus drentensis TaxID=220684 RepID=UPI0030001245